ncbi:MAG: hypothetical protein J6V87_07840 [Prevotella sp.]|nr:hypothetical protein [Prevotella sp.]
MKEIFKLMSIALLVAMSMAMVSCSDNDDNGTNPPSDDEYKIEVGEGMEMPENKFLKVPAVAGDQNIINALKSIDKVTDVKAFEMFERYDYWTAKKITKTAYYFNYKQDIDHNNPSKGWFKQQCVLTVADQGRPTVLHTEGYALEGNYNELQNIGEPTLVSVLDANCLQVEYRYHGWSLPEGYTNKWNYLTAKQHSDDLHAIVTAIKKSGVVGNGKWLSTGVSKNGMTTAHYAYYYPNEMDAYVPFCAPFLLELTAPGPYSHILTKEAFDDNQENLEKVKAAFRAYVGNKSLQAECVKLHKKKNPELTYTDENIRYDLLGKLFDTYYAKMAYVPFKKWEDMIPKEGDPAQKFYDFLMADDKTKYAEESDDEYERRQETSADLEPDSSYWAAPRLLRRAASVKRKDPYFVQVCIELGSYNYVVDWVNDLLTPAEKKYLTDGMDSSDYGVIYDKGQFVKSFLDGMKQSNCHMMFVYGMQDPWTGGQIPDGKMGANSKKLFIQHPADSREEAGLHNDYIEQWNASERSELFRWLNQLGFLTN